MGQIVFAPLYVPHRKHPVQKLRLDLSDFQGLGNAAFGLGRGEYGGDVVVTVDINDLELTVRRVDGKLVAQIVLPKPTSSASKTPLDKGDRSANKAASIWCGFRSTLASNRD